MTGISTEEKEISVSTARAILWNEGIVHWTLHAGQKGLYDSYTELQDKMLVWNASRRIGKSWTLCVIALETCLKTSYALVKYCCAKQVDAKGIIRPLIRDIIRTCPKELRPVYKTQERAYVFPNGSRIELSGLDGGRAESLRGGSAHLAIIDEAGIVSDLEYIVNSIILPTTTTTKGKIILASTPPKSSAHPFIKIFLNTARINGTLVTKTIYDNPLIDAQELEKIKDQYGGENSVTFRREFLCVDEDTLIKSEVGYKKIKDVQIGEKVFTHKGNYKTVKNVFKNPLAERLMYEVKSSNNLGFKVTEGHKLLVTKTDYRRDLKFSTTDWVAVEDIKVRPSERIYFKVPIDSQLSEIKTTSDLAYLAGWYAAEGNCGVKNQTVVFSLSHNDPINKIQEAALKAFDKYCVKYLGSEKQGCTQWYLNSKAAKEYFKNFGTHSTRKRVTKEIKTGTDEVKLAFLEAYFKGDGCTYERQIEAVSVSLELLMDISDMLLSLGIGCQIKRGVKAGKGFILGREVNLHDSYCLSIGGSNFLKYKKIKEESYCTSFVQDGFFYSRIKSIRVLPNYEKSHVYDLEVEDDHSYVGLHGTFHNCHIILDEDYAVIPEFTAEMKAKVCVPWPRPPFYDCYTAMDLGLKDLTVVLFAYYDFRKAKIVIEDEFVINGQKFNTTALAEGIKEKERATFTDPFTGEERLPYLRVSDNNLMVIQDLWVLHGLRFLPTRKDEADAALNNVKVLMQQERIIINPRCKVLISHLESAVWNKNKTSYERSGDKGHFDAIDSLKYLVRNIQLSKNPYPASFGITNKDDLWQHPGARQSHPNYSEFAKIFNIKK